MTRADVVVIGAGPAGSATATLLARAGAQVTLLERGVFPRTKPCAEYLSPEAGRILARLGVLEALAAEHPARLRGMRVVAANGTAFTGRFAGVRTFTPFAPYGLALPRERLDLRLAEAAVRAGARLREGAPVAALGRSGRDVEVRVGTGRGSDTLRAPMVIGADGLHSRVAAWLGVARRGPRRRIALVTRFAGAQPLPEIGEMHVGPGAYVGLAPVGRGLTNVAAVVDLPHLPPGTPDQRLAAVLARFSLVRQRLRPGRQVEPTRAVGPFARWTTRASGDGVLLVGDAADFYDPFTGEGIFAALRGAELAAARARSALASGRLAGRQLAGYDRDRRRVFGGKWFLERAIGVAVAVPRVLNHVAARLARRQALADLVVGATGDFVPCWRLLLPDAAVRMVW